MTPKTLYKFRDWANLNHQNLLTKSELWFCSKDQFNDPFDCSIPVRYDRVKKPKIIKIIEQHIKKDSPHINRSNRRIQAKREYYKSNIKDKDHLKFFYNEFQPKYRAENFGICSLSQTKENIVLWSYYSDSHMGFCVAFDYKLLKEYNQVKIQCNNEHLLWNLYKVNYVEEYPYFDASKLDDLNFTIMPLITKSNDWRYEEEHRLICTNFTKFSLPIDNNIITEIILGCKMQDKHISEIKNVLNKKKLDVKLLKASMKSESFGLNFNDIEY